MSTSPQTEAAAGATTTTAAPGVLDGLIAKFKPKTDKESERAKLAIEEFIQSTVKNKVVSKEVEPNIKFWISEIDKKLSAQLNEIMHNPEFQKLEGTWRGLFYLVDKTNTGVQMKIRVLNARKKELARDLERASEFDQSVLFKKIYEAEYGVLGGTPYGLLVGDYEFDRMSEDVTLLSKLAGVAAAAHAPFVTNASPQMFGFERMTQLSDPRDLANIFDTVEYAQWKSFRESDDSRYVGLTMPKVLGRLPYGKDFKPVEAFNFEEMVDGRDHDKYLWMGAAWAYASRITDAFDTWGWFSSIRGVENGGKVEGLPVHTFPTDDGDVAMKCPTEIAITDRREFELSKLGFLPLIHSKGNDFAVFMGAQSAQKPKEYFDAAATANAALSAKFNLILNTSRFAHYLKVMGRDKIGSAMTKENMEDLLNTWILNYCVDPNGASAEMKAKRPLAEAKVHVQEVKGKPGTYESIMYMRPHDQFEELTVSMRLVAEIPKKV